MICQSCRNAADLGNPELHEFCDNTRLPEGNDSACDCHHRVGTRRFIQEESIAGMPNPIIPEPEQS